MRGVCFWHTLTWKSFSCMENMSPFENITSSNSILDWRWVKDSVETQKPSEAPEERCIVDDAKLDLTVLKNVNPIVQWWRRCCPCWDCRDSTSSSSTTTTTSTSTSSPSPRCNQLAQGGHLPICCFLPSADLTHLRPETRSAIRRATELEQLARDEVPIGKELGLQGSHSPLKTYGRLLSLARPLPL